MEILFPVLDQQNKTIHLSVTNTNSDTQIRGLNLTLITKVRIIFRFYEF